MEDRPTATGPYPCDTIGYGRTPLVAERPDRSPVAIQDVIDREVPIKNDILHGEVAPTAFMSKANACPRG